MEQLRTYIDNSDNPSLSRRCAAVLIKLASVSKSFRFSLEIDSSHKNHTHHVQRPVSYLSIIMRTLEGGFEGKDIPALRFYWEVRHFLLNYECESVSVRRSCLNHLLVALYRHVDQWLISFPNFHPVETCNDLHCLISNRELSNSMKEISSVTCGRCQGTFSLSYLNENAFKFCGFYDVSVNLVSQSREIWICPLCLQDDTSWLAMNDLNSVIYEWGSSSNVP